MFPDLYWAAGYRLRNTAKKRNGGGGGGGGAGPACVARSRGDGPRARVEQLDRVYTLEAEAYGQGNESLLESASVSEDEKSLNKNDGSASVLWDAPGDSRI